MCGKKSSWVELKEEDELKNFRQAKKGIGQKI